MLSPRYMLHIIQIKQTTPQPKINDFQCQARLRDILSLVRVRALVSMEYWAARQPLH